MWNTYNYLTHDDKECNIELPYLREVLLKEIREQLKENDQICQAMHKARVENPKVEAFELSCSVFVSLKPKDWRKPEEGEKAIDTDVEFVYSAEITFSDATDERTAEIDPYRFSADGESLDGTTAHQWFEDSILPDLLYFLENDVN